MGEPVIVFFDTFCNDGETKNTPNFIRFNRVVQLSEIRIVPFGSVIESTISDEAIIGATNPASFVIQFYGYDKQDAAVLHLISERQYSESSGIECIKIDPPMQTHFLLLRGTYSTITLAVFGLPFMPSLPPSLPAPDFSVPPPPLNQINSTCRLNFPVRPAIEPKFDLNSAVPQSTTNAITQISSSDITWVPPNAIQPHTSETSKGTDSDLLSNKPGNDDPALYEDGEIQVYETISSNDELFSDSEEQESMNSDPRLEQCYWRFDPLSFCSLDCVALPAIKRIRLPDPSFTLFEIYCWFLSNNHNRAKKSECMKQQPQAVSGLLLPPTPDSIQAKEDADFLLSSSDQFGIDADKFDSSWVLTIEKIVDPLPSGLAYLSLNETDAYDFVVTCLLVWTQAGLDLTSALNQSDPTFILRHLRAGIELVGLIMSTTCEDVCKRFLHSDHDSSAQKTGSDVPTAFNALHVLIDLLESPLLATPLRIAVIEALDRSTRLPIGVDAFLGRLNSEKETLNESSYRKSAKKADDDKSNEIKYEDDEIKNVEVKSRNEVCENLQLTPYQRFVLCVAANKSSHVAVVSQRLLMKIHTYELIVEFCGFIDRLKVLAPTDSVDTILDIQRLLQGFLAELTNILSEASSLLSNPGKSLKCVVDASKCQSDAYPTLCRLLASTHFLDHMSWILELSLHASPEDKREEDMTAPLFLPSCVTVVVSACLPDVLQLLSTLLNRTAGLLLLASNPVMTSNLLKCLLQPSSNASPHYRRAKLLGVELATKLEAIKHIDRLIALSRQEGVTGLHALATKLVKDDEKAVAQSVGKDTAYHDDDAGDDDEDDDDDKQEGLRENRVGEADSRQLYDAVFGLARLFVTPIAEGSSLWVAQLLASDEFFLPCLMLLEAFANVTPGSRDDTGSDAIGDLGCATRSCSGQVRNNGTQRRSFITRLGFSNRLEASSLLATISNGLLLYAEDVTFLTKYAPRLLQLVQPTSWEDSVSSLQPALVFSHLRRFSETAAPWLYWLRDAPPQLFSSGSLLAPQTTASSFGLDAVAWLCDQLTTLSDDLDRALDSLISLDVADDLGDCGSTTGPQAGHSPPPALLLVLRALRAHTSKCPVATTELFSRNGLSTLCGVTERISEHLIVLMSTRWASEIWADHGSLLQSPLLSLMLANTSELVAVLVEMLVCVLDKEFRDTTPIRAICRAYSVAFFLDTRSVPLRIAADRIRKAALSILSAYAWTSRDQVGIKPEAAKKSLWTRVCKEIIQFTVSATEFFLPGLKLLLDILPQPLPITVISPVSQTEEKQIMLSRDWWFRHLACLPMEICGLVELLSCSSRSGLVFIDLIAVIDRIASLGAPLATMLATAALDVFLDQFVVAGHQSETANGGASGKEPISTSDGDTQPDAQSNESGRNATMVQSLVSPSSSCLLTAGTKLVLGHPMAGIMTDGPDEPTPSTATAATTISSNTNVGEASGVPPTAASAVAVSNSSGDTQSPLKSFSEINNPIEVERALCFLYAVLRQSICKQAFLELLRESESETPTRVSQFVPTVRNILQCCSDSKPHITAQILLIESLDCLFDNQLGMHIPAAFESETQKSETVECAHHLPAQNVLDELVSILLTYLDHPDRDLASIPRILNLFYRLSSHDFGFSVLQRQLRSPKHEMALANVIRRVNDSFSADNPDYRTTLALFLRLIGGLLDDPVFDEDAGADATPSRFLPMGECTTNTAISSLTSYHGSRRLHFNGAHLRRLLGWKGQNEDSPVRELSSLLEMLAEENQVHRVKHLQDGMRHLLHVLSESESEEVAEIAEDLTSGGLPNSTASLSDLFVALPLTNRVISVSPNELFHLQTSAASEEKLNHRASCLTLIDLEVSTVNLTEITADLCPGLDLREELRFRWGRRRAAGDAGTTTRHQKRRKGQSSIIQMGRSCKKFVAPMRGRGFNIRNSGGSSGSLLGPVGGSCLSIGGSLSNSTSGGSNSGGGPTPSLLGAGGHRPDVFRSRPQNTSRPPSLHVDDFNKLEKDETGGGGNAGGSTSDKTYGRDDNSRFRGHHRDIRQFRGRGNSSSNSNIGNSCVASNNSLPTVGGGGNCLLSNALIPGMSTTSFRQGQRVLSSLPYAGISHPASGPSLLTPTVLPNWMVRQPNLLSLTTPTRSRSNGLLPPRHD